MLRYTGLECFRQRIVFSLVSSKSIEIFSEIPFESHHESILSILSTISSDGKTKLSIVDNGQLLELNPGTINGGKYTFKVPSHKDPFYYLEPLVLLSPIASGNICFELKGVSNTGEINSWKNLYTGSFFSSLSIYSKIFQIVGIVGSVKGTNNDSIILECSPIRRFEPISCLSPSPISRLRGSVKLVSIPPAIGHLVTNLIKNYFSEFLNDIWIMVDSQKTNIQRPHPFLGLSLIAENKYGAAFTINKHIYPKIGLDSIKDIEKIANPEVIYNNISVKYLAEEMALTASKRLLSEIITGGWIDSIHQHILFFFMALAGDHKLGKLFVGNLTGYSVAFLRHLYDFFKVSFSITPLGSKFQVSCVGCNYNNILYKIS